MVRLGDVISVTSGGTPRKGVREYYENGDIPWVKTGDLKTMYISETDDKITELGLKNCSAKMFPKDTLLVALYGATIGACSILKTPASTNQACAALLPTNKYLSSFLYYYFINIREILISLGVGGAQPNISGAVIKSLQIPLPPLPVQQQIADVLDRASALIEKRKEQIEKLDLLVKSRFIEMFGDPVTNPMGWEKVPLSNCLKKIDSGNSFICEAFNRKGDSPAILKLSAITYGIYNPDENKELPNYANFDDRMEVFPGDLLFSRKNTRELVGKSAYVYSTPPKLMLPDLIFRLVTLENCNRLFLWQLINHPTSRAGIQSLATGSAGSMPNISKQRLMQYVILLPPLDLQESFAKFMYQTENSKLELKQGMNQLQHLYKSLMQKCFRGELF
jgi:type I restriction enzyme S subunit